MSVSHADLPRRIAGYDRFEFHILDDYCARADHRAIADLDARTDEGIGSNPGAGAKLDVANH